MGVYLSAPIVEKESLDEKCNGFTYGASSMQGWRMSQEDAHNCIPEFVKDSETSFFAVYDGHGGAEVAKYCERFFPDFVKGLLEKDSKDNGVGDLIQSAFLSFDATLAEEEVVKKLKEIAGKDDDIEEDEDPDIPVGRTEADMLKAEADIPLEELLAQYKSGTDSSDNVQNGESSGCSESELPSSSSSLSKLPSAAESSSSPTKTPPPTAALSSKSPTAAASSSSPSKLSPATPSASPVVVSSSSPSKLQSGAESSSPNSNANENNNNKSEESSQECNEAEIRKPNGSSDSSSAEVSSTSGSSVGIEERSSKTKAGIGMAKVVCDDDSSDDDDDDDDDDDMWKDCSDDDDDDDDDDEHVDNDVPMMDMTNEEPGSDSGCTACVVLKQGKKLIVANAGDSRCVLSRNGVAEELSLDHKPEDDPERERIEKAGGKVTADGRVNGGLNLSRAFGDHVYKRNKELPLQEQMISPLPDIKTIELSDKDEFFIIACDGIWNSLSSQEVIDFIHERLSDPEKRKKPSLINEELFDHCLAPNILGDGTGCDNMTSIIVVLDSSQFNNVETDSKGASVELCDQVIHKDESINTLKRTVDDDEHDQNKKTKVDENA